MTVSIVFEVQVSGDDVGGSLDKLLRDCEKLPWADRETIIGQLMIFRGTQILERAAGARAIDKHYADKKARAAATRAAKANASPQQ